MLSGVSLSFTEPHQYQECIRPAEVRIIPTTRGDFQATLSQTNLQQLTLQRGWQSLPTVVRTTLHKSRSSLMFGTGAAQSVVRANGIDLSSDVLALGAPGEEHFLQTSSDCSWASLTLTPTTYAQAAAALVGDRFDPSMQTTMIRPAPASMDRLRAVHHGVMRLVASDPDHRPHPEAAKGAEQALLLAVVDCLVGESGITAPGFGNRNSTALMRRLYELLEASEGLPLYLIDVCAQLRVSRRTLHAACAEHLGLSPHRFLSLRRLHLARQALLAADPRRTSVTEIATNLGFWELGRFSVHYKWLFGESPSVTLGSRRR